MSQINGFLNGFKKKFKVFKNIFVEKKLIHFPCCELKKIELDDEFNF